MFNFLIDLMKISILLAVLLETFTRINKIVLKITGKYIKDTRTNEEIVREIKSSYSYMATPISMSDPLINIFIKCLDNRLFEIIIMYSICFLPVINLLSIYVNTMKLIKCENWHK